MRPLRRRGWYVVIGLIVLVALGSTVAYATIPDANGEIHGCYDNSGRLRVIDDATQICSQKETELNWSQTGPPGPPGPKGDAGTALGYAFVHGCGGIDGARSKNVTSLNVSSPGEGIFCFNGLPFTPNNIIAMPEGGIGVNVVANGSVRDLPPCPGSEQASVYVSYLDGQLVSSSFLVLFN